MVARQRVLITGRVIIKVPEIGLIPHFLTMLKGQKVAPPPLPLTNSVANMRLSAIAKFQGMKSEKKCQKLSAQII